ncbi:MAG: ribosomal protein S18-alanine N-acetyltransferase [Rhizobiaceae bacterium]|nr:ribosomal protein S18-alanine N-acetyltransferase [Rhizobiaceae bacterium]
MRIPFMSGSREFVVRDLRLEDAEAMEQLHAESFARPWSEQEFESLLVQQPVFGYAVRPVGAGNHKPEVEGFVLARLAADEAEILTIVVSRSCRRRGLGRMLMDAVLRHLHIERAEALFLEVDESNAAALGLYRRLGFRDVGRREGYYSTREGRKTSALVMRRDLR